MSAVLTVLAVVSAAWSAIVVLTGGVVLFALGSSKDPWRPLVGAVAVLGLAFAVDRQGARKMLVTLAGGLADAPRRTAIAISVASFVFAVAWNTAAAGGSDSSCYILQADAFRHGQVALREPLAREIPIAHPDAFLAPTGFLASPRERGAAVPICAPGLAIGMAAASLFGAAAMPLVVPACAALLAWSVFVLARRLDDEVCGVLAAAAVAASPIVLYQSVQPMSDIPAAALFVAACAAVARADLRGAIAGGVLASAAVLVRPNLALPMPLFAVLIVAHPGPLRARVRRVLAFGIAAVPCAVTLGWLNGLRYGSPFVSGYGDTGVLFAWAHVRANAARYASWLLSSETPFVLLALGAPLWAMRRRRAAGTLVTWMLLAAACVVATYLAYTVFDEWWYLRFLLPAIPLLLVLASAVAIAAAGGSRGRRLITAVALGGVLVSIFLTIARQRRVFDLPALEARFVKTGVYAARNIPADALVLAVQESGAIRHHGGRLTGMWDQLDATELDAAIAWLTQHGRPVFVAIEDAEEARFRARFVQQSWGQLDWPPRAEIHGAVRVLVYATADRERFRRGEAMSPEHVY